MGAAKESRHWGTQCYILTKHQYTLECFHFHDFLHSIPHVFSKLSLCAASMSAGRLHSCVHSGPREAPEGPRCKQRMRCSRFLHRDFQLRPEEVHIKDVCSHLRCADLFSSSTVD